MGRRRLENVSLQENWTSLAGAVGGLLHHIGRPLARHTVMGLTGHAFRLTLDRMCTPFGLYEFNLREQLTMYQHLGLYLRRVVAGADQLPRPGAALGEPVPAQAEAWRYIVDSIDRGFPVIAWDILDMPEYGLITGYDADEQALYGLQVRREPTWFPLTAMPEPSHLPWTRLDVLALVGPPEPWELAAAERHALKFAVDTAWVRDNPGAWSVQGLDAYEYWAITLGMGEKNHPPDAAFNHAYLAVVAAHARADAAAWLTDLAQLREPGGDGPLHAAANQYSRVAGELWAVHELLPFPGGEGFADPERRRECAAHVRAAARAERGGLAAIEEALKEF